MKLDDLNFFRDYTDKVNDVNRIIVTSFLQNNNINKVKNIYISNFIITEDSIDFDMYMLVKERVKIVSFDDLIKAFEYIISPTDKVVTGAVYTPEYIRENIVDSVIGNKNIVGFSCDPACGCGGFLFTLAKKIKSNNASASYYDIYKEFIFGLDLKDYSVERTKILLTLLAIVSGEDRQSFQLNIYCGNALNFEWDKVINGFNGFDIVVGNPPYVASRNIDDESIKLLKNWSVCKTGHPDLYIPFFEIGLSILKDEGTLGFITMNTFFKSLNGRALREYFGNKKYCLSITDFGSAQVFSSRNTYTCICIVNKTYSPAVLYRKINNTLFLKSTTDYNKVEYDSMDHFKGWNLSHTSIINKVERVGKPLKDLYKINSGIATLKNSVYIIDIFSEDAEFFSLKCGSKVEKSICVDIVNPNKLIETSSLESLKKKIIFPYKYLGNEVCIIPMQDLIRDYPCAYSYLKKHKDVLSRRDKGKGNYEEWYAYGRKQGMVKYAYKLFFPHITPKIPNYILSEKDDLLFHNGLAAVSDDKKSLKILKVIMSSRLFWFYVTNTSKPYGSGYYSLSNNYIKSFGIFNFTNEQKDYLLSNVEKSRLDEFIEEIYGVDLSFL